MLPQILATFPIDEISALFKFADPGCDRHLFHGQRSVLGLALSALT